MEKREYHSRSNGIFFEITRTLFEKKSRFQDIEIVENPYFGRILFLDGLVQTTERDEFYYHEMLIHPAAATQPDPQRILIIGGGDGGSLVQALRYPVKSVRMVEIDPDVIDAAKEYFPWLLPSLEDKRTEIITAEGREYLERTPDKYDIVYVDSSEPTGPSVTLHERNFFEIVKDRLTSSGIVCAQMGAPFFQMESLKRAKAGIEGVFRIARFYLAPVPTYPGGNWCYVFLSDQVDPLMLRREPPEGLKYYNKDVHRAAFALPNYLRQILE